MRSRAIANAFLLAAAFHGSPGLADGPSAEELARKAQEPLAEKISGSETQSNSG